MCTGEYGYPIKGELCAQRTNDNVMMFVDDEQLNEICGWTDDDNVTYESETDVFCTSWADAC